VAKRTKYEVLADEVARVERIPADRAATAEEARQVDDLAARLRISAPGGQRYRNLYKRAKSVQARITASHGVEETGEQADSDDTTRPPPKKKTGRGFGRIYNELSRIAAIRRPLKPEELTRLDDIVEETRAIAAKDPYFRRLHLRAKLIRTGKTPHPKPARQSDELRGVLPAGLVGSSGLHLARREVLGGHPSSRRGH
jgi:hypothetical protein